MEMLHTVGTIVRCRRLGLGGNLGEVGVALPSDLNVREGVVRFSAPFTHSQIQACDDLSLQTKNDMPLGSPLLSGDWYELNVDVWIWCCSRRAIAMMITQSENSFYWLDEVMEGVSGPPVPCLNSYRIIGVWVAEPFRGTGISSRIVHAAARYLRVEPKGFVHSPPFSCSGIKFAEKWSSGRVRIDRPTNPLFC